MRKYMLFALALWCGICASAQSDVVETTTTTTTTVTSIDQKLERASIRYVNDKKTVSISTGMFSFGWNIGLNMPEHLDKSNGQSMYVAWDLANVDFNFNTKNHKLSAGFGMIWNKYYSTGRGFYYVDNDMIKVGMPEDIYTEDHYYGCKTDFSRYLTYALSIPVEYTYTANNKFYVTAGVAANFNVYSSIRSKVDDIGEIRQSSVYQNPVTMDLRLLVGYKHFGLMFKYSPISVIQSGKGPSFQSLGIGLVFK